MVQEKQNELDGMPEDDRAAKIAREMLEANDMISEGNERRQVLQEELTEELKLLGRSKIRILHTDGSYKIFTATTTPETTKIKITTEKA